MGFRTSLVLLARFAPVGMLLGIKKIFFSLKIWLHMLANTAYPVYQTTAVAFTRIEGCFTWGWISSLWSAMKCPVMSYEMSVGLE